MPAAISDRLLLLLAGGLFAVAGLAHVLVDRTGPGSGWSNVFYLAVALAALAGGAWIGAAAGVLAAALSLAALFGDDSADVVTAPVLLRAATYVLTGLLVGWLGGHNRRLVSGLRHLADADHLTGLANRRAFERELARRCEGDRRFVVLLGDVDGLKAINDGQGHSAGDRLLKRVASILRETLRDEDTIARIGGDEFGLLIAATGDDDGAALAVRLEQHLLRHDIPVSFGWALHPAAGSTPPELVERADERLYSSKAGSKGPVARRIGSGS